MVFAMNQEAARGGSPLARTCQEAAAHAAITIQTTITVPLVPQLVMVQDALGKTGLCGEATALGSVPKQAAEARVLMVQIQQIAATLGWTPSNANTALIAPGSHWQAGFGVDSVSIPQRGCPRK